MLTRRVGVMVEDQAALVDSTHSRLSKTMQEGKELPTAGDRSAQAELSVSLTHSSAISPAPMSPQSRSMQHRRTRAMKRTMIGTMMMMNLMIWIERRATVEIKTRTMA